ncbi:MAG: nidogen-like domain-containing protein [Solirubrobacteraceae bacterium]|jgi:hypothetical protein
MRVDTRHLVTVAAVPAILGVAVALAVLLAAPQVASAAANAVVPTSPSPGTSATTINNYVEVTFPANDDGTWPCGGGGNASPACPGPAGQTGPTLYPIGFNLNLFGAEYNSVYVNTNGNVTFSEPLAEYTPQSLTTFGSPIIAPFFADVDTRGPGSGLVNFGTGTLNGDKVFVVNWPDVGCYDENTSVLDDFQMILIDRPDIGTSALGDDFYIEFNYDSIQWDTGEASSGDVSCQNGQAMESAFVGYSNGSTTPGDSYNLPGSGVPNAFLDSSTSTGLIYGDLNSTTLGRYIFGVINGQPSLTLAAPTTIATSLAGDGQSGSALTVPVGTAVTDSSTLSGSNASTATGTVTYNVYSDAACTVLASAGSPETIATPGTMPASQAVSLTTAGTYYWQVVYGGDANNITSTSPCSPGETETVIAPPTNVTPPQITGATKAGSTLTCSTGSWTNAPTGYTYQWYRDGTALAGATSSTYKLGTLDEGTSLTCAVTASNIAGHASATSGAVTVPIPHVKLCPGATGHMTGTTIGQVKLGMTRKQARFQYRHHSNRGKQYEDFFCLTPIGVRVGYASPKLLTAIPEKKRGGYADKVVWASTSDPYYELDNIRPGESLAGASTQLHFEKPFHIGLNYWYLDRTSGYTAVLKVRGAVVEELGIATNALTANRHDQGVLMASFY